MKKLFSLIISFAVLICVTNSSLDDSCTISKYEEVDSAARRCDVLTLGDIVIPKMKTLEIPLKTGAKLIFDGHITHVPVEWNGHLIKITGDNVEISGTENHLLDGMGPHHWKGNTNNQRPKVLKIETSNARVHDLHVKNCPHNCIQVQSSNTNISDVLIDNKDGYPAVAGENYAKNTDGFDVSSSTNVKIRKATIHNQDDCIVVNSGTHLHFERIWCNGSHGLSFSVSGGDTHDVLFSNCFIAHASSAIHIKTHSNSQKGSISNVTYENITFIEIKNSAINIQQNYPSGEATANVKISNLTLKKVQGTVPGGIGTSIICAEQGCSDWHWEDVKIYAATQKNECHYVPAGIPC